MDELTKVYNPKDIEDKWYGFWEAKKFFQPSIDPQKKPYTIVIPPPNVTGTLHMGHALNNVLQDILIRWKRMKGMSALWLPGTDHAGIATQNVVEQQLAREGLKRQDLGREKFVKRVWRWKKEYGNTIVRQLKKLGCSCDWSRESFTLDDKLSRAVQDIFIRLYKKGLIYRGSFIVNWCPRCQTALSDEEVQHQDTPGNLYYIKYPFKDNPRQGITVATTRPETMLGDTAVAVNPRDNRYKHLVGKKLNLPIVDRTLEIIADEAVDSEFGTGAVKITPCHDPNDYQLATIHHLKGIIVMNPDGTMNSHAGNYQGMDRLECREALLTDLKERGLLEKIDVHQHSVGHCYRCHTMIEPYFSEQWFVKMKPLARPAIKVVKQGKVKFYPDRWTKVYLDWMNNIRDWCISRQIWWGHRIPAWFCQDCYRRYLAKHLAKEIKLPLEISVKQAGIVVSASRPEKCPNCGSKDLKQDEDILDTWFSSWLWPFSTLGWPEDTDDLRYFYPTSTLVTGYEIIFFWVARMIMAGLEFVGKPPFKHVYIHGIVRDETGTKMSKSLGNVIDPLDVIKVFGADALRFSIISITASGQDVFLSEGKCNLGRNFANKIWNAARFILMNMEDSRSEILEPGLLSKENLSLADRWILSRLSKTIKTVDDCLTNYRFNEAANTIYEFFWHQFCDWYIELVKPLIVAADKTTTTAGKSKESARAVLCSVLETSMRLLHPFMPFITEEIWQRFPHRDSSIMISYWPKPEKKLLDEKVEGDMDIIIGEITALRNIRSTWNISPRQTFDVEISVPAAKYERLLSENLEYIKNLCRVGKTNIGRGLKKPKGVTTAVVGNIENYVLLKGIVDIDKEKKRLSKQVEELSSHLARAQNKLKNKSFIGKAPAEVIERERQRKVELKEKIDILKYHLEELK